MKVEVSVGSLADKTLGPRPESQSGPDVAPYLVSLPLTAGTARSRISPSRHPPAPAPGGDCHGHRLCQRSRTGLTSKFITLDVRCRLATRKLFAEAWDFQTMTGNRLAFADFLQTLGVTHVALKSTGVLWNSVWNTLAGRFSNCRWLTRAISSCWPAARRT
jgi:hypothetical protein